MIARETGVRPDSQRLPLADLLGPETADTVQTKTKDHAVLFAQAHVPGRELSRDGTAVPAMTQGNRGVDQRTVAAAGSLLEVEEERRATEQSALSVAQKH